MSILILMLTLGLLLRKCAVPSKDVVAGWDDIVADGFVSNVSVLLVVSTMMRVVSLC